MVRCDFSVTHQVDPVQVDQVQVDQVHVDQVQGGSGSGGSSSRWIRFISGSGPGT
jgi:hypothetical protein